ncbi:MAG: YjbH domain-containing protein, partial [Chlamydiota bacterium]
MRVGFLAFSIFLLSFSLFAEEDFDLELPSQVPNLFDDLNTVAKVNREINDELPFLFNYQLQGGYFAMPSARMAKAGTFGFQYSYENPYQLYNLLFQLFDHLELTGNYWLYTGIQDVTLGEKFGTFTDRAANVKLALLQKQDGLPELPEFAIGVNDFIGTMRFTSWYVVATQTFLKYNLELSLGWGNDRIKGFFGALAYTPFRKSKIPFLKDLTFAVEYDANDYKNHREEHPSARQVKSPINVGVHYKFLDFFHLTASTIRGVDFAGSAAFTYNIGETKGLFPKIYDPTPYVAPIDNEPIGILRTKKELGQELAYAFQEQGFETYTIIQTVNADQKDILWIKLINVRYRIEDEVRNRILHVLSSLIPDNIFEALVVVEADGVPVHQYRFRTPELMRFQKGLIGEKEFQVVAPLQEASSKPSIYDGAVLYRRKKSIWMLTFRPQFRSYWGSASGKFKYDVGFISGPQGYLFDQIYYDLQLSYIISSSA